MLTLTTAQISAWLGGFFWPFVRVSAMMVAAPVFNSRMLPVRIRILMAFAFSLAAVPMLPPVPLVDPISYQGIVIVLQQVIIGLAMGFMLQMVFQSLVIAGESIANSMGLGFARMVDPANGIQVPVVSQFLIVMATLLFVVLNGHLMLIDLVIKSFQLIPVNATGMATPAFRDIANWGTQMFAGAFLVAIPAVAALMVVNLSMGVVTRAAPQLNIFAVGFPLMILLGFVFLAFTTPSMLTNFTHLMMDAFDAITRILAVK